MGGTSIGRPPTLEQIDANLSGWQTKIAQATDNILALYTTDTYKRLELVGTRLTGFTERRLEPALAAMQELFAQIDKLNDVVNRALALRKSVNRFLTSERSLRELDDLLNGPSIQLQPVHTPLAQRSLLSASDSVRATTPDELMGAMVAAFEEARDAVCAVEDAWNTLDSRLSPAEAEMTALAADAQKLGAGTLPSLQSVQDRVRGLRDRVETDPLGANSDFTGDIQPLLAVAHADLDAVRAERVRLEQARTAATASLDQLRTLYRRSIIVQTECGQKIVSAHGPVSALGEAQLASLAEWLSTLQTAADAGRQRAALIGLDRWNQTCEEYRRTEMAACQTNIGLLEQLAEYRGRLSALKMKASARSVGEDPQLTATALSTESILGSYPARLDDAAVQLGTYEQRLNLLVNRNPNT